MADAATSSAKAWVVRATEKDIAEAADAPPLFRRKVHCDEAVEVHVVDVPAGARVLAAVGGRAGRTDVVRVMGGVQDGRVLVGRGEPSGAVEGPARALLVSVANGGGGPRVSVDRAGDTIKLQYFEQQLFSVDGERYEDADLSVAETEAAPGVLTALHSLEGVHEVYVVVSGSGHLHCPDAGAPQRLVPGDVVVAPAGARQCVLADADGGGPLRMFAVCAPPFDPARVTNHAAPRFPATLADLE